MACVKDELLRQNRKAGATLSAMNKITQTMLYRQSLISYAEKHGVTKAAIRYNTNHQYIYHWRKRYDGTLQSLADRSHRPHHHPNQHRPEEIKLIDNMRRRNPQHRSCGILGQASAERVYQIHFRPLPFPAKTRSDGCETAKSQVYSQAL